MVAKRLLHLLGWWIIFTGLLLFFLENRCTIHHHDHMHYVRIILFSFLLALAKEFFIDVVRLFKKIFSSNN